MFAYSTVRRVDGLFYIFDISAKGAVQLADDRGYHSFARARYYADDQTPLLDTMTLALVETRSNLAAYHFEPLLHWCFVNNMASYAKRAAFLKTHNVISVDNERYCWR